MRRFYYRVVILLSCILFACSRTGRGAIGGTMPIAQPVVPPIAVLQAGEFPLWFQFTAEGPALIETIEQACFSAALIPWPLAPHVRFSLSRPEELIMAVNGDGLIRFSLWEHGPGIGLYRIYGGEFWRPYTVGGFVRFEDKPVALLYRDDRFFDSDAPLPSPRLWTLTRYSALAQAVSLPSLDAFAPEDGWDMDVLREGADGCWYFRAVNKNSPQPEIRMFRADDLALAGEQISLGAFQNAAVPEDLSAAPEPLREMLAALFTETDCKAITVISPELQSARGYALDRESPAISGFYSGATGSLGEPFPSTAFLLAAFPRGSAVFVERGFDSAPFVRHFFLPPLPDDFVYTGIGMVEDTIIAAWEEQDGYSIGAAGFMVIRYRK